MLCRLFTKRTLFACRLRSNSCHFFWSVSSSGIAGSTRKQVGNITTVVNETQNKLVSNQLSVKGMLSQYTESWTSRRIQQMLVEFELPGDSSESHWSGLMNNRIIRNLSPIGFANLESEECIRARRNIQIAATEPRSEIGIFVLVTRMYASNPSIGLFSELNIAIFSSLIERAHFSGYKVILLRPDSMCWWCNKQNSFNFRG